MLTHRRISFKNDQITRYIESKINTKVIKTN